MTKKVLIVDDNEMNRTLIRGFLELFSMDHNIKFEINEAVDGTEAVAINQMENYHLIFMDIMMPKMNGIEATYQIRKHNPNSMIIAVSAADDAEYQKSILQSGAEDYLSKPINMEIFMARLTQYLTIIDTRYWGIKRGNRLAWNLFNSKIMSHRLDFYIRTEEDLSEFWEYFLYENKEGNENLSNAVRTLYTIGMAVIEQDFNLQIVVEESLHYSYMTIINIKMIARDVIEEVIRQNPELPEYKINSERISIQLPKLIRTPATALTR